MYRVITTLVVCVIVSGCNKEQTAANCRLEIARKWDANVLRSENDRLCIQSRSSTTDPEIPTCSDVEQASRFMVVCMNAAGYELADHCSMGPATSVTPLSRATCCSTRPQTHGSGMHGTGPRIDWSGFPWGRE